MPRQINLIAAEIYQDWKSPNFGAIPYLDAMLNLQSVDDYYGLDTAKSVILYFLANAGTWRGEVARRVKLELKGLVK